MRRIITPILALALLMSCSKQDSKVPANTQEDVVNIERKCASQEVLIDQMAADPKRADYLEALERKTENYKGRNETSLNRLAGVLYVPVVVHVVHTNANIVTDAQIQSQINVLNKDYNKTNAELANSSVYLAGYPYATLPDCDVEFYVKQIVRKQTTVASFGTNDAVKKSTQGGSNPVNAGTMLNMWVCDLSSGLLGYAQFPGGNAATDGVVIDLQGFGTQATGYSLYSAFNLGRTATHEVGHWLNLRHIWGDARCGNDLVDDTPAHDASNGGCPSNTLKSQCSGKPLEQWMNYMDYTNDACMYMFTAKQKLRMDAAIDNARKPYVYTTKI